MAEKAAVYEQRQASYLSQLGKKTKLTGTLESGTIKGSNYYSDTGMLERNLGAGPTAMSGKYNAKTGKVEWNIGAGANPADIKTFKAQFGRDIAAFKRKESLHFARSAALSKLQPKILDLAGKRGFSETAKKAAKNIAGFTLLYYIFSGGSKPTVAGGDKATQEVVTVATEGADSQMLSVDEINESISALKSALENLAVPDNQKPRIREHIAKLSDIATALEACKQPVSTDQFGGFSEKIKNAEAKINAYLPILEKVTAHLEAKYPEQGNLAVEVLENLQMFLDSIKSTRKSMKSEG